MKVKKWSKILTFERYVYYPVMFSQEECMNRSQARLNDGSLVSGHKVGRLLRRMWREPALSPCRKTLTRHSAVNDELPVLAWPESVGRDLVRPVDVAGVDEGGDAVELLPGVAAGASAVGASEGMTRSSIVRVELVFWYVNIETSSQWQWCILL